MYSGAQLPEPQVQKGNYMTKNRMKGLATGVALIVSVAAFSQASAASFEGFGQDIPLESAARQIVPSDYKIDYGSGVNSQTAITWSSAADWQSALAQAVAKKGLKADFGAGTVVISKSQKPAASTRPYSSAPNREIVQKKNERRQNRDTRRHAPAAPENNGPRVVADLVSAPASSSPSIRRAAPAITQQGGGGFTIRQAVPAPVPAPQPVIAQAPAPMTAAPATGHGLDGKDFRNDNWKPVDQKVGSGKFIVVPGYDLRTTLESWAAATGWTVNWKSEFKYQIEADATFSGTFVEASSALINAMRDARPTITVDFYAANNVVVISNNLADEVN